MESPARSAQGLDARSLGAQNLDRQNFDRQGRGGEGLRRAQEAQPRLPFEAIPGEDWSRREEEPSEPGVASVRPHLPAPGPFQAGGLLASEPQREEPPSPPIDAHSVWEAALSELALGMPAATFETWVRDSTVLGYEDGEFLIGVPNSYVRDWLANRLRPTIKATVSKLLQRSVEVTFRVRPTKVLDPEVEETPLYRRAEEPKEQPRAAEPAMASWSGTPRAEPPQEAGRRMGFAQPAEAEEPRSHRPPEILRRSGMFQRHDGYSSTPLNPRYTFETFVVGSHNRLAHAAAKSVAERPGQQFNPLFVYGGVGLGKTHLLHAIGHEMMERNLRVLYCSSEQFTNDLISAIRNQSTEEFRNKYREIDLLLIDDIQFIGGKESTQEEFFHTFNHLHAAGRQVVISSDRPPKEIATLEARLRSRFEGGLQVDISPPDLETRVAILQAKAAAMGAYVPTDVLMLVAERVESNIRELEGALNRLILQAPLHKAPLNRQIAEVILDDLIPQRRPREPQSVVRIVAEHFRLTMEEIVGRKRTKDIAHARQVAMYLLREENDLSLPAIGDILGGRDHSTVRYGVEKVTADLASDETLRRDITALREKIYAPPGSF